MTGLVEILIIAGLIILVFFISRMTKPKRSTEPNTKYNTHLTDSFKISADKLTNKARSVNSKICSICNGSGQIRCQWCNGTGKKFCSVCGGSGQRPPMNTSKPYISQRCTFCFAGKIPCNCKSGKRVCTACSGKGTFE